MRTLRQFRRAVTRRYLKTLMRKHGGNIQHAAEVAGIDRSTLYEHLREHMPEWEQQRPRRPGKWDREPDPRMPSPRGRREMRL